MSVWSGGVALAADLDLFISLLLFLKNFVSNFKNRQIDFWAVLVILFKHICAMVKSRYIGDGHTHL